MGYMQAYPRARRWRSRLTTESGLFIRVHSRRPSPTSRYSVTPRIGVREGRLPPHERTIFRTINLDLQRKAIGGVIGMAGATVAPRAGRQCTQQIYFREELDEIPGSHRTCFHEVLVRVGRKPAAHEDVQYVVDVGF